MTQMLKNYHILIIIFSTYVKTCSNPSGPLIANPPINVFEASNVPLQLENEKTGTVNCTVENTLLLRK